MVPDKIDHAALPQKASSSPTKKHGRLCQALYGSLGMFSFGRAKENDLARFHLLCRAYRFDH